MASIDTIFDFYIHCQQRHIEYNIGNQGKQPNVNLSGKGEVAPELTKLNIMVLFEVHFEVSRENKSCI